MTNRVDETWHRLREWTYGSAQSERLAAQILHHEGFEGIDPSHPLGGKDGGRDAHCMYASDPWIMAVHFSRGERDYKGIKEKFLLDVAKIKTKNATGVAFVTNQELRLSERNELENSASPLKVKLFHLERIAGILDRPEMELVRQRFLSIETNAASTINNLGGAGGNAIGAGGGGGGAIGEARGGDGGKGGDLYNFSGAPGALPGAGGGGAGTFGPSSQGGEGGQGGEYFAGVLNVTPGMSIPVVIGEGGKSSVDGGDGGDGGHSSFGDIFVKGGKGGKAGSIVISSREVSEVDRDAGLHISTLMLADCYYFRHGLAYILGAGIEHISLTELPGKLEILLIGTLSIGEATAGIEYEFTASMESPSGDTVWSQPFKVFSGPPRQVARAWFAFQISHAVNQPGIWTVLIYSASHCFARLPIAVLVP